MFKEPLEMQSGSYELIRKQSRYGLLYSRVLLIGVILRRIPLHWGQSGFSCIGLGTLSPLINKFRINEA